jgi:hypothetical protein
MLKATGLKNMLKATGEINGGGNISGNSLVSKKIECIKKMLLVSIFTTVM